MLATRPGQRKESTIATNLPVGTNYPTRWSTSCPTRWRNATGIQGRSSLSSIVPIRILQAYNRTWPSFVKVLNATKPSHFITASQREKRCFWYRILAFGVHFLVFFLSFDQIRCNHAEDSFVLTVSNWLDTGRDSFRFWIGHFLFSFECVMDLFSK